jgi:hypothetical protein
LGTINQGVTNPPIIVLSELLKTGISDIDAGAKKGIAITLASGQSSGSWQYTLFGGTPWISLGAVSKSAARLLPASAYMRFVPRPDFHGEVKLYYRAWDQTQGTAGGLLNTTANGGKTSLSRGYDNATLKVRMAPLLEQNDTTAWSYALNDPGVHFMWGAASGLPATLETVDRPVFSGGHLNVHTTFGRRTGNRIDLSWNFSIVGTSAFFKTTKIGTVTADGKDGNDLRIVFNDNAELDLVRRLINSLTFSADRGTEVTRKFEVRVFDGAGGASQTLLRTVNVK